MLRDWSTRFREDSRRTEYRNTALGSNISDEHAVFLSGNGPLVDVFVRRLHVTKSDVRASQRTVAEREVRSFIQNIHHFRDDYVGNEGSLSRRLSVFDEAQTRLDP